MTNHRKSTFQHMGATVTESSTWPCSNGEPNSPFHGHVEDSMTVAPDTPLSKD